MSNDGATDEWERAGRCVWMLCPWGGAQRGEEPNNEEDNTGWWLEEVGWPSEVFFFQNQRFSQTRMKEFPGNHSPITCACVLEELALHRGPRCSVTEEQQWAGSWMGWWSQRVSRISETSEGSSGSTGTIACEVQTGQSVPEPGMRSSLVTLESLRDWRSGYEECASSVSLNVSS